MFPPHFSFFRSFTQDDTLPAWLLFAVCTLVGSHLGTWGILSTAGCLVGDLSLVQHCPVSRQPPTEQAVSSFVTSFFPEPKTWKAVSTSWDVFQLLAKSYLTLCNPMVCSTPVFLVLHYLPEFAQNMSIELEMPSKHLILCHPFSSGPQSFPASGSFLVSWLFTSGGQSIGVSAPTSPKPILPFVTASLCQGHLDHWMSSWSSLSQDVYLCEAYRPQRLFQETLKAPPLVFIFLLYFIGFLYLGYLFRSPARMRSHKCSSFCLPPSFTSQLQPPVIAVPATVWTR